MLTRRGVLAVGLIVASLTFRQFHHLRPFDFYYTSYIEQTKFDFFPLTELNSKLHALKTMATNASRWLV